MAQAKQSQQHAEAIDAINQKYQKEIKKNQEHIDLAKKVISTQQPKIKKLEAELKQMKDAQATILAKVQSQQQKARLQLQEKTNLLVTQAELNKQEQKRLQKEINNQKNIANSAAKSAKNMFAKLQSMQQKQEHLKKQHASEMQKLSQELAKRSDIEDKLKSLQQQLEENLRLYNFQQQQYKKTLKEQEERYKHALAKKDKEHAQILHNAKEATENAVKEKYAQATKKIIANNVSIAKKHNKQIENLSKQIETLQAQVSKERIDHQKALDVDRSRYQQQLEKERKRSKKILAAQAKQTGQHAEAIQQYQQEIKELNIKHKKDLESKSNEQNLKFTQWKNRIVELENQLVEFEQTKSKLVEKEKIIQQQADVLKQLELSRAEVKRLQNIEKEQQKQIESLKNKETKFRNIKTKLGQKHNEEELAKSLGMQLKSKREPFEMEWEAHEQEPNYNRLMAESEKYKELNSKVKDLERRLKESQKKLAKYERDKTADYKMIHTDVLKEPQVQRFERAPNIAMGQDFTTRAVKSQKKKQSRISDGEAMVFGNVTDNSIVFKAVHDHVKKNRPKDSKKYGGIIEGIKSYFEESVGNEEDVKELNKTIYKKIETAQKDQVLNNIPPKEIDSHNMEYVSDKKGSLKQTIKDNGEIIFKADKKFSGIVSVERRDKRGKLISNQKDIIEFENGKVVAVILASSGISRIEEKCLEDFKEEATQDVGMRVFPEYKKSIAPSHIKNKPSNLQYPSGSREI